MSETPTNPPTSDRGSVGSTSGATTPVPDSGTTGNLADAAPTQANPTDSSSVSDDEGVQSLAAQGAAGPQGAVGAQEQTDSDVDHEGTGPGNIDNLPESDADDTEDGVEKETPSDEQDS